MKKIIGDTKGDNWERLNHEKPLPKSDPLVRGYFRWIEYGTKKMYAVAVWIPHYDALSPGPLDFIVFYPPTTKAKAEYDLDRGHTYPYGLKTGRDMNGNPERTQPYITEFGHKYLFERLHLTYQLVAVRKKAIIVLPINDQGDFGPLTHKDGIHRLLLELAHFVRKGMQIQPPSPTKHIPIPSIRRVIVAGYSNGTESIVKLLAKQERGFGPSYVKNQPEAFDKLWKEIWDLDLAFKSMGEPWVGYYKSFLKEDRPDRCIRMYHSEHTLGPTPENPTQKWRPSDDPYLKTLIEAPSKNALDQRVRKKSNNPKATPDILVEEYHLLKERWTIAYFSFDYLKYTEPSRPEKTRPEPPYGWGGPHDFTVNIGFAHAARLSELDELK